MFKGNAEEIPKVEQKHSVLWNNVYHFTKVVKKIQFSRKTLSLYKNRSRPIMPPETSWAKGRMSSATKTPFCSFYSVPFTSFPPPPSLPGSPPPPPLPLLIFSFGRTQTQSSLCYPLKIQPSVCSHLLTRPGESQITHILFKRNVNDKAERRSQRSKMTVTKREKREQTQAADSLVVKMTCHCVEFFSLSNSLHSSLTPPSFLWLSWAPPTPL